jgi:3-oxoacyl-[acyl-carrier-protein] synthase-3
MRIAGTGSFLPGREVTTAEIRDAAFPDRTAEVLERSTGIRTRHWCHEDDTIASVSATTLRRALASAGMEAADLRRVILVSSFGFDIVSPATANQLMADLGVRHTCDCMDLSNSCTGFITGVDLAARCVATGLGPVAVVATELPSKYLTVDSRRPYAVFGDGSGAAIIDGTESDIGILGSWYGNDGVLGARVHLARQPPDAPFEPVRFSGSNDMISQDVIDTFTDCIGRALKSAECRIEDIRWFLLHQPNGVLLRQCSKALDIPMERMMPIVEEVGSISSASVPVSLDRLVKSHGIVEDDLVLCAAVGSGLSYGAMVLRPGRLEA